jgi:hypothetical protein
LSETVATISARSYFIFAFFAFSAVKNHHLTAENAKITKRSAKVPSEGGTASGYAVAGPGTAAAGTSSLYSFS